MITGIHHNAINVLNMEESLDFYVNAVGMKRSHEIDRDGKPWIVYLKIAEGAFLELFYGGVKDRGIAYSEDLAGYHHWSVSCTDLDALADRIRAKGYITAGQTPAVTKNGGRNLWIHDPDGNALELVQPLPKEEYGGRDELLGFAHLGLVAPDMKKTLDFYCGKLGFEHIRSLERDGKPWIEFVRVNPSQSLELFYGGDNTAPNGWDSFGSPHSCYCCPDVPGAIEKLRGEGVSVIIEPKTGADGKTQGWVADPDGYRIELMNVTQS